MSLVTLDIIEHCVSGTRGTSLYFQPISRILFGLSKEEKNICFINRFSRVNYAPMDTFLMQVCIISISRFSPPKCIIYTPHTNIRGIRYIYIFPQRRPQINLININPSLSRAAPSLFSRPYITHRAFSSSVRKISSSAHTSCKKLYTDKEGARSKASLYYICSGRSF